MFSWFQFELCCLNFVSHFEVLITVIPVTFPFTGVDLRSSKVCELGLFNYKAKHVFYPFEKSKFRCRYDYYWASVFKVTYFIIK